MSSNDLIDFHVGPPFVLPVQVATIETYETDNLIDTELPVLEQKLLTQCNDKTPRSRRESVDVEDILINIDEYDRDSLDGEEVECDDFLDICERVDDNGNADERTTLPADNFEALLVLKNLDDLLNATLEECEDAANGNSLHGLDDATQHIIEECLGDLDNYLHDAIDDSESSASDDSLDSNEDVAKVEQEEEFDEELARIKLRQIEENYRKFVAAGIVNRGYVDTENNGNFMVHEQLPRPSSACAIPAQLTQRKRAFRSNSVNLGKEERPRLIRRKSVNEPSTSTLTRTSAPAESTAPKICSLSDDDVNRQRHAHASADCCTGTVIVEPLRRQSGAGSSSDLHETVPSEPCGTGRSTWLRSSMRRLQQLTLPNVDRAEAVAVNIEDSGGRLEAGVAVRPVSAPSRLPPLTRASARTSRARSRNAETHQSNSRTRSSSESSRSRRGRSVSSSGTSADSSGGGTLGRMPLDGGDNEAQETSTNNTQRRSCDHQRTNEIPEAESPLGKWPHSMSSMMACLGCTLGLFNISRFAVLTIHFGANFIFQFMLLSLVFGLPLFTLQLCLGQQLGTGVIDMWRISPLFQGVGVSLLITQALTGFYSIIGVSWMFVYFRDSFITALDKYRWAEPFLYYRKDIQTPLNGTYKLTETVPDYFNGIVLQRYHLPSGIAYGTIKFQSAFNLAVIWMIVFVSLSKGLRSYGKVIYMFTLLPVFGTFVLCAKILGLMPPEFVNIIFPETSWGEFFLNSRSWLAAAQETFLTWGLLGAATMQIASHNKHKHLLQRDSSLIAVMTISVLLLVAFLANTCVQILKSYGYSYYPSSFERISSYQFLRYVKDPLPPTISNTPVRYMKHNSFILGEKVIRPGSDGAHESGYQVLRLATEILPATFAVMGADQVSPFWAVLTYFIFIMFGIAQQLAIWHCLITGIMAIKPKVLKKWESTITFFSCACGFILGLPMATELGIYVVYFMDYTLGSIWWLTIVIIMQILAVFLVRGRPYSGDTVVTALFTPNSHSCLISWAPPLLSFTWNVILPVVLMILCITTFKNGNFRDMFVWHHAPFLDYWPLWARQVGSMMQLLPVLCIPFVAVIQSYRYLNNGPSDILEELEDPSLNVSIPR
ncbi:sodium-dependent transporter bedraggled isoform X2 [Euwallacea fornicatus]|uniref:sodium-dependent transporter bedraggled isoform X2 n=1 Tax=Euwallacea fornicatus TaxID=995702 RepID=UPI00338EFB2A